jgi:hypothetical protein
VDVIVVLMLGVAAGVGVYAASMRWDRPAGDMHGEGFLPEDERLQREAIGATAESPAGAGGAYVPLAPGRRSVQTRLLGLLGIAVLVPIAAVTFAVAVYWVGRMIVETIARLIENAGGAGVP